MKPRRVLDFALTPDRQELVLYQHGDDFQIDIDGYDLMSSRSHGSEEELARLALGAFAEGSQGRAPRVLIGGLGMGFTLRAALDALDEHGWRSKAKVEVAEVFQAVVDWNRSHFGHLAEHPLRDRRVVVSVADVRRSFENEGSLDVVMLDVDNGPEALTLASNDDLYSPSGLRRLRRALAPGGVAAVWSSFHSNRFLRRFKEAGFSVTQHRVRARPARGRIAAKGQRHVIFLGRRV